MSLIDGDALVEFSMLAQICETFILRVNMNACLYVKTSPERLRCIGTLQWPIDICGIGSMLDRDYFVMMSETS